jgi:putative transcriptional regulator
LKPQVPKDYSSRIKALRKHHSLTQTELAEMLGVSFSSINRWENGQAKPTRLAWRKIEQAEILGMHVLEDQPPQVVQETGKGYQSQSDAPDLDFTSDIVLAVLNGNNIIIIPETAKLAELSVDIIVCEFIRRLRNALELCTSDKHIYFYGDPVMQLQEVSSTFSLPHSPGSFAAEIELFDNEIQGLCDAMRNLLKAADGHKMKFHVRVEADEEISKDVVEKLNQVLEEVNSNFKLK